MSEMVEKVAKAIADAAGSDFDRLPATHGPGHGLRNMYLRMARAAIEAMRETTEAMLTAGDDCCGEYGCGVWRMREIFTAQIDAALKD